MKTFGQTLDRILKQKNMTIKRLSEKSGIEAKSISLYKHDKVVPSIYKAYDIACGLKVPISEFFK